MRNIIIIIIVLLLLHPNIIYVFFMTIAVFHFNRIIIFYWLDGLNLCFIFYIMISKNEVSFMIDITRIDIFVFIIIK